MDASLYDGFDKRAHSFFEKLLASTDRKFPNRKVLKAMFIAEVRRALPHLESSEINKLRHSFIIAFKAYHKVVRRNGEAYIFHVLRGAYVLIWVFEMFGVCDTQLLHLMFQHDSYEETSDIWYEQILIRAVVRFWLGKLIAQGVNHLTQREGETDTAYEERMRVEAGWREILVKLCERTDNVFTLEKKNPKKSKKKIQDTLSSFKKLEERLRELVREEFEEGKLSQEWLDVIEFIIGYLWYSVAWAKREFGLA